jgi:two-component system OmpR family response regulator
VSQRILVVEDDPSTRDLISQYLAENHFEVECAATGALAEASLRGQTVDLVLLDLNLPDQDGLMLARKLTGEHSIPVVILTGRSDEMDRVLGLELGADDYVTKPFSPRELLARVRAVLRRAKSRPSPRTQPLRVYRFAEFSLLAAFVKAPQQILSRDQLLEASRLYDDVYDRSIDVQILRLRRKIEEDPSQPRLIKTERGAGYYLDCSVEES